MTVRRLKTRSPNLVHVVHSGHLLNTKSKTDFGDCLNFAPPSQTNTVSYTSTFLPCHCPRLSLPPSLILRFPTCSLFFPRCRALRAALWPGARCHSPEKVGGRFQNSWNFRSASLWGQEKKKKKDWDPLEVNLLPAKKGILLIPPKNV